MPGSNDRFHIQVAWEERDDPIWHDFAVLDQDASKISHHGWVIPHFKPRADGHLITAPRNHLVMRSTPHFRPLRNRFPYKRQEGIACQRHRIRLLNDRCELEHLRVHVQRRYRPRSDHHTAKSLENRLDGDRWVQTPARAFQPSVRSFPATSTHVRWNIGLGTVALSVSNGSKISRNPPGRRQFNKRVAECDSAHLSRKLPLGWRTKPLFGAR